MSGKSALINPAHVKDRNIRDILMSFFNALRELRGETSSLNRAVTVKELREAGIITVNADGTIQKGGS